MKVYKLNEPLVIGWRHETVPGVPDVDLTPFKARGYGVSRRHAMIVQTTLGLTLTDLGSTNGTFVGREQLKPHQPYSLKNKDVVRFGGFLVQIHFKNAAATE
jgi:pSer/pThr/pTyr-binding forkhead associated (FHA) protein